jgi:hypothetical protein
MALQSKATDWALYPPATLFSALHFFPDSNKVIKMGATLAAARVGQRGC